MEEVRFGRDPPAAGTVIELDMRSLAPAALGDDLVDNRATALLLLGRQSGAGGVDRRAVRSDQRLAGIMIGAPAGQPDFAEWARHLGDDGAAIPFLRYLPERLGARARWRCASDWPRSLPDPLGRVMIQRHRCVCGPSGRPAESWSSRPVASASTAP